MVAHYARLLDNATVSDGDVMDLLQALDLGDYRELDIIVRVVQAGDGDAPKLVVEHSASNEEDGYLPFSNPVEVDLKTTGKTWSRQSAFTRWIAWRVSGTLTASAVVILEIVARP